MKYVVDFVSKSSGRLGSLIQSETGRKFETPMVIQATLGGSIPHLSREVFDYLKIGTPVLRLSLANMDHMADAIQSFNNQTAEFVGYKGSPLVLTINDPTEIELSGFNEQNSIPLFTRRGKETLTASRYMDLVEQFQPDIYQSLCDSDTVIESSKKRIRKSLDRSKDMFLECSERHKKSEQLSQKFFLASVVGGFDKYTRSESIKLIKTNPDVSGYLLDGFHKNGWNATQININSFVDVVRHCMNELNDEKPKFLLGAIPPLAVLESIQLGVDVFDNSFAYVATDFVCALTFNFNLDNDNSESEFFVWLNDDKYKEDFTPILQNCTCLACRKHTKAYIVHLFNTRELLGSILVMIHNIHHYHEFFKAIRKSIADDKLPELIELIKKQPVGTEFHPPRCLAPTVDLDSE